MILVIHTCTLHFEILGDKGRKLGRLRKLVFAQWGGGGGGGGGQSEYEVLLSFLSEYIVRGRQRGRRRSQKQREKTLVLAIENHRSLLELPSIRREDLPVVAAELVAAELITAEVITAELITAELITAEVMEEEERKRNNPCL